MRSMRVPCNLFWYPDREKAHMALASTLTKAIHTMITHASSEKGRAVIPPITDANTISPFLFKVTIKVDNVEVGWPGSHKLTTKNSWTRSVATALDSPWTVKIGMAMLMRNRSCCRRGSCGLEPLRQSTYLLPILLQRAMYLSRIASYISRFLLSYIYLGILITSVLHRSMNVVTYVPRNPYWSTPNHTTSP